MQAISVVATSVNTNPVGALSNTEENISQTGAWKITNKWDDNFIKDFQNELWNIISTLGKADQKFTCDDLALHCIISFASRNNLPFKWNTEAENFDASNGNYSNVNDFMLAVKRKSGAPDFANDNNTSQVDLRAIQTGTINVLTSNGRDNPNHVQVIVSVARDTRPLIFKDHKGTYGFFAAQGNFNGLGRIFGSDDPKSWRYLGVSIQLGTYDVKSNVWNNISKNETTTNFIGEHYSNQYRNFNYLKWNQ